MSEKVQHFNAQARRIREAFRRALSKTEPLIRLHNRQVMTAILERERERAIRTDARGCIVLAEIDYSKSVKDTHGHAAGDFVLRAVAGRFFAKLRPYDEIFRYGGEEFLVYLPDADLAAATEIVGRLRLSVAELPVTLANGKNSQLTGSFVLCLIDKGLEPKQTIEHADRALYAAKHGSRNQLQFWSEEASFGEG